MAKEIARRGSGALERSGRGGGKLAKKTAAKHTVENASKHAAKKAAKHAAKKAPPRKDAGGTKDRKHSASGEVLDRVEASGGVGRDALLGAAFHALHRAVALISLLEQDSGGDLRMLLDRGIARYREATGKDGRRSAAQASGLLRAAEHLGMAGLYAARSAHRVTVDAAELPEMGEVRQSLPRRLDALVEGEGTGRLRDMAMELARRAEAAEEDAHLEYELAMAAHWICVALEGGLH